MPFYSNYTMKEIEQRFIKFVEEKQFNKILSSVKKNSLLLELKNVDNKIPYLFIIVKFITTTQLKLLTENSVSNIIDNPTTDISDIKDENDRNILQYAIDHDLQDIALYLINNLTDYNLNVNHADTDGLTALHCASIENHTEVIKSLLNHSVIDVNMKDKNGGDTALHYAVLRNHIETIRLLVKHPNTNVNLKNMEGLTAMFHAAQHNRVEIAKVLLDCQNIDINLQTNEGCTPLHCAASNNYTEFIEFLLNCTSIEINIQDSNGYSALHVAAQYINKEATIQLLSKNKILKTTTVVQNKVGEELLFKIASKKRMESVKLLLKDKNINLNLKNKDNETAYEFAVRNNIPEVPNLIKSKETTIKAKLPLMPPRPCLVKTNSLPVPRPRPDLKRGILNKSFTSSHFNSNEIESDIKRKVIELKKLKITLKIQKREEQLEEIQKTQHNKQTEINSIENELKSLYRNNEVLKEEIQTRQQKIADVCETIKTKESKHQLLLKEKKNIDTTEKENELKQLKDLRNNVTETTEEDIEIECPICFDQMYNKRVYQCSEGHHYCETCKPKIKQCPYCCEDISKCEIRNRYIEQLLARLFLNQSDFRSMTL